jgi:hypothetical protein
MRVVTSSSTRPLKVLVELYLVEIASKQFFMPLRKNRDI